MGTGKPVSAITVETTDEFIDKHTLFTEADEKRLEELRKQLAKLIAPDPIKEAALRVRKEEESKGETR